MNKLVLSAAFAAALAGSAFTYNAVAAPDAADAPRRTGWRSVGFCSTPSSPA